MRATVLRMVTTNSLRAFSGSNMINRIDRGSLRRAGAADSLSEEWDDPAAAPVPSGFVDGRILPRGSLLDRRV